MFQGHSTLGAVALRLIEDNNRYGLKASTRYSLDQAVEVVCHRQKSIYSMGEAPSYIWWWFAFDEYYGGLHVRHDVGKLSEVCLDKEKWKWRGVYCRDLDSTDLIREWEPDTWWNRDDRTLTREEMTMIAMGLQPYQRCLSRFREEWHTDYWGESDCEQKIELLYVEPTRGLATAYLPVPVGDLVPTPATMKELRFAGY
jgi:hypothetical protein